MHRKIINQYIPGAIAAKKPNKLIPNIQETIIILRPLLKKIKNILKYLNKKKSKLLI